MQFVEVQSIGVFKLRYGVMISVLACVCLYKYKCVLVTTCTLTVGAS